MISVFTPLSKSGNAFVREAYESLLAQTHSDWEWVVLENNGGELPPDIAGDGRVRRLLHDGSEGIGALKRRCCKSAKGELLFELDHDDVLHERALERAWRAHVEGADFVFSDFAEFKSETLAPNVYMDGFGWRRYPVAFRGKELVAHVAPEATPQNMRRIYWAPNHLRAWRREFYDRIGGHEASLEVADDHDLVLRTYLAGGRMVHVAECLYFYRVHEAQATNKNNKNALIQQKDEEVYQKYILLIAQKFADDAGLRKIDLCGGINPREGFEVLDKSRGVDLDERWPLEDSSVGVITAFDAIEHLRDKVHTMNEAHRVLAPGGFLITLTPSTDGRGAFQDPTHVSLWNENSFWYYTDRNLQRYVPAIRARFQVSSLRSYFPTDWHRANAIPYAEAHLIALKDGYSPMGEVKI